MKSFSYFWVDQLICISADLNRKSIGWTCKNYFTLMCALRIRTEFLFLSDRNRVWLPMCGVRACIDHHHVTIFIWKFDSTFSKEMSNTVRKCTTAVKKCMCACECVWMGIEWMQQMRLKYRRRKLTAIWCRCYDERRMSLGAAMILTKLSDWKDIFGSSLSLLFLLSFRINCRA